MAKIHLSRTIITLKEAKTAGLKEYFTGELCSRNHIAPRWVSSRGCIECFRLRYNDIGPKERRVKLNEWHSRNPSKKKEYEERWRLKNPEKLRKKALAYFRNNRERLNKLARERSTRKRLSLAGRDKPSACEICGVDSEIIVFDHCHSSGTFRGWLCSNCNVAIGLAKEDPAILENMARYLEKHHGSSDGEGS